MKTEHNIIESLNWRYATKIFDPEKKVSEEDLFELTEVLRLSPSSFGLQPWKFIVVTDPQIRKLLKEHSWNQSQVADASHLIVLCARTDLDEKLVKSFIEHTAKIRGVSKESLLHYEQMILGTRKSMSDQAALEWAKKQVYIALGFLMEAAALKKIDTCPMEGFDASKYDEILGLKKENLTAAVLCPIGYRSMDDKYASLKKVRFERSQVLLKK
jgi:nitroreductase